MKEYRQATFGTKPGKLMLMKLALKSVNAVSPSVAAEVAKRIYLTPPSKKDLQGKELHSIQQSHKSSFTFNGKRIAIYTWGEGPTVILAHGWGSRGGRMTSFVNPLLAAGFSVLTYDAPAHGESAGKQTSLPEMAGCLEAVNRWCGGAHSVVGHSLGGAAIILALSRGMVVNKAVLVSAPADVTEMSYAFAQLIGLPENARALMQKRIEKDHGMAWDGLTVRTLSKTISVPLLVFHDKEDEEVALRHGLLISESCANAEIVTTEGLGHKAIVRNQDVISRAVRFLRGGRAA